MIQIIVSSLILLSISTQYVGKIRIMRTLFMFICEKCICYPWVLQAKCNGHYYWHSFLSFFSLLPEGVVLGF